MINDISGNMKKNVKSDDNQELRVQIAGFTEFSVADGPDARSILFFQGCHRKCPGCHNKEQQNCHGGKSMSVTEVVDLAERYCVNRCITLSGGDPLEQLPGVLSLCDKLKSKGYDICLYTGGELDEVPMELRKMIHWLKVGPFIQKLKSPLKPFVGSSNQRMLELDENGEIIKEWISEKPIHSHNVKMNMHSIYATEDKEEEEDKVFHDKRAQANGVRNTAAVIIEDGKKHHINSLNLCKNDRENHEKCRFHMHDMACYDITYNCLGVRCSDLINASGFEMIEEPTFDDALYSLLEGILLLTNAQSGGIGFIDADNDLSYYIQDESDREIVRSFSHLFRMLNSPLRQGQEKAYVTFNFGLGTTKSAQRISHCMMQAYSKLHLVFPNLVFKVSQDINRSPESPNYKLFQEACECAAENMIPTFLNMDASFNKDLPPESFGVMGCRTRMGQNRFGDDGALHRGNIAALSINLPQIALNEKCTMEMFKEQLKNLVEESIQSLMRRYECLKEKGLLDWQKHHGLYMNMDHEGNEALKNGTLSVGFIGLFDALAVLHHQLPTVENIKAWQPEALEIVRMMREITDKKSNELEMNISLLASSGEGICGRFAAYDKKEHGSAFLSSVLNGRDHYTNSYHVPVETQISAWEKIKLEAPFHALCNGGHISYVELQNIPIGNSLAIETLVSEACINDMGYFAINFPLDECRKCGFRGTFGISCPACNSQDIKRLRRVSGYLSDKDTFTTGKADELKNRVAHEGLHSFEHPITLEIEDLLL